jgi:hypothetical protein
LGGVRDASTVETERDWCGPQHKMQCVACRLILHVYGNHTGARQLLQMN